MNQQVDNAIGGFDEGKPPRPVISQKMTLHLNYGSEGHGYHYEMFADGKPTKIIRASRSKHGKRVSDRFICGDEEFDLMGTTNAAAIDWMIDRLGGDDETHAG